MKHLMKLQSAPFESIKAGRKVIEMRLLDEKRRNVRIGDIIEFTNITNNEKLCAKVLALHKFKNFEELYRNFNKTKLGYAENEVANPKDMSKYYADEEIKNYGVLGIEIEKI